MARTTVAALSTQVSELAGLVAQFIGSTAAVHATPAPVVEITAPLVALVEVPAPTAADTLKAAVEAAGLAFAKGGRVQLNTAALQAAVRVLKSGTPEILPVEGVGNLDKRNITHLAIGLGDAKSIITQYVYSPTA